MKRSEYVTASRAKEIFQKNGGVLRTGEALANGINPKTLYFMRDKGMLEVMSRGVYKLEDTPIAGNEDFLAVSVRVPKARICLLSALAFHQVTTQIPKAVYCAIPRNTRRPNIDHPPVRCFRFSNASYEAGVERHEMTGVGVQIYCVEKTLADCFKYRNRLGMDTVLEALRYYRERKRLKIDDLLSYARICRVYHVLKPYLEAVL